VKDGQDAAQSRGLINGGTVAIVVGLVGTWRSGKLA